MKRILGLLGWLGVVLVVAALALRFTRPDLNLHPKLALAGLVVTALYTLTQWRDIVRSFRARNVKYGSIAAGSVVLVLGILVGINWISARQNKRWDLTASKQFSLSDQTKQILRTLQKPVDHPAVLPQRSDVRSAALPRSARRIRLPVEPVSIEYVDADKEPFKAKQYEVQAVRHGRVRVRRPARADDHDRRAGAGERAEEGARGQSQEDLFRPGPRRARPDGVRAGRLQRHRGVAEERQLRSREAHAGAGRQGA